MNRGRFHFKSIRISIISFVLILLTLTGLLYLMLQSSTDTNALSEKVRHFSIVESFLNGVSSYVSWSVRQWAHVFEFLLVGIVISIFYAIRTNHVWKMFVLALGTCVVISICDQSTRIFINGRHFDSFDLILDALGYISAIIVMSVCRRIYSFCIYKRK